MSYHDLPQAILTHLAFTLVSVLFGLILGVVLGILLSRRPKLSKFVLPVLSVFNTIPGIVFVGLLFIWLGMQPATVLIALSISAATNPVAELALAQLPRLSGCEVHSSVMLAQVDTGVFKKLGMNLTCEPHYQTKKLYHK